MVLMMTLFVAFMVITEKRIAANRWDCLCCCVRKGGKSASDAHAPNAVQMAAYGNAPQVQGMPRVGGGSGSSTPDLTVTATGPAGGRAALHDDEVEGENLVKKFFRKYCECGPQCGTLHDVTLLRMTSH